jgi:hypothetical protein
LLFGATFDRAAPWSAATIMRARLKIPGGGAERPTLFCLFILEMFMKRKYKNEAEVLELVRSFEDATIPHDDWRHAEHLVVAVYYLTHHDPDTACSIMRSGILNLLAHGFRIDLEKEMPYHETITIFWMRTVAEYNASRNGASLLEKANEVAHMWDKDYPLRFYSRDLLFSDAARSGYVEADLAAPSFGTTKRPAPAAL